MEAVSWLSRVYLIGHRIEQLIEYERADMTVKVCVVLFDGVLVELLVFRHKATKKYQRAKREQTRVRKEECMVAFESSELLDEHKSPPVRHN